MGSKILDRTLNNNSFLLSNKLKDITTVFPATTTAATTSMRTGLNPVEHGWLGWNTYISPIDKTITLFMNSEKGTEEICQEFLNVKYDRTINKKSGKKYIYAYDEPDHSMHDFGPDNQITKELILEKNQKVLNLCNCLEDTVIIIVADHGHIKVDHIYLNDYPEILNM